MTDGLDSYLKKVATRLQRQRDSLNNAELKISDLYLKTEVVYL